MGPSLSESSTIGDILILKMFLNIVSKRILTFSFEATGFVNVLDVPSKPRLLKPDEVIIWTFEDG